MNGALSHPICGRYFVRVTKPATPAPGFLTPSSGFHRHLHSCSETQGHIILKVNKERSLYIFNANTFSGMGFTTVFSVFGLSSILNSIFADSIILMKSSSLFSFTFLVLYLKPSLLRKEQSQCCTKAYMNKLKAIQQVNFFLQSVHQHTHTHTVYLTLFPL